MCCSAVAIRAPSREIFRWRNDLQEPGGTMSDRLYDYDPAVALESDEAIAVFLSDALETGDPAYIAKAMAVVARAKGMTELARAAGLPDDQLEQRCDEHADLTLGTLLDVTRAMGIDLMARPHEPAA